MVIYIPILVNTQVDTEMRTQQYLHMSAFLYLFKMDRLKDYSALLQPAVSIPQLK